MSNPYNSETDHIKLYNDWNIVSALTVCLIGLGISVSMYYHITGGLLPGI